jgi:hypothetical protein
LKLSEYIIETNISAVLAQVIKKFHTIYFNIILPSTLKSSLHVVQLSGSPVEVHGRSIETNCLHLQDRSRAVLAACLFDTCLAYPSVLEVGTVCSYETSVNFSQTTQHGILKGTAFDWGARGSVVG